MSVRPHEKSYRDMVLDARAALLQEAKALPLIRAKEIARRFGVPLQTVKEIQAVLYDKTAPLLARDVGMDDILLVDKIRSAFMSIVVDAQRKHAAEFRSAPVII